MNLKIKFNTIIWLFLLFSLYSTGQSIHPTVKLDTNAMMIGDQVRLKLGITVPAKTQVRWPMIGDTILEKITVIGRSKIDTALSKDKQSMTLSQQLLITSFDSGFYTLPSIRFYYRQLPDTTVRFEDAMPVFLKVNTVKVDTTLAIKPIKGPLKVPITFREMLPWIIGFLLLAGLIVVIIYFVKKLKKKEPIIQLKPRVRLLPHEAALSELEKLRVKKLWQSGKVKEYHSELTDILRKYIEDRFGVKALESTTGEIMDRITLLNGIEKQVLEKLYRILSRADMVKFAKDKPLPEEHEESLDLSIQFVNETIEKSEPVTPEKGGEKC
ncbi:MAG: hypothetical protein Q8867_03970 [Bacteroidota bacterium]|nr:hypothetical protein [Bacteroidota bacterium]